MASSFTAQLNQIAINSTNELDLKAQKASHARSLIFDAKVAGNQDFETIFQICLEGYSDLCHLDERFREFERNLFSPQSKRQERNQMTVEENAALDTVLEEFLSLAGARLLLHPAVKAVEWLVRRFQVHVYNTSFILLTFLPYHETPIFRNLLTILPPSIPAQFKFLGPYIKTATNPPRHAVAYSATNNDGFFTALNGYALQICRTGTQYQTLVSFWASIATEAVAGRLGLAQSGRKEIQRQRQEDILLKVLPVLNDAFSIHNSHDLTLACYAITIVLATKSDLADNVLERLMEAVAGTLKGEKCAEGLICMSILVRQKLEPTASKRVAFALMRIPDVDVLLKGLSSRYDMEVLVCAVINTSLELLKKKHLERINFIERLIRANVLELPALTSSLSSILLRIQKMQEKDAVAVAAKSRLLDLVRRLNEDEEYSLAILDAVSRSGLDPASLEINLQSLLGTQPETIAQPQADMDIDAEHLESGSGILENVLAHLPERTVDEHSFLTQSSRLFEQLAEAFVVACRYKNGVERFEQLPIWQSASTLQEPFFISFFVRIACSSYTTNVRTTALRIITKRIQAEDANFDAQALLPYVSIKLADSAQFVRREASNLLLAINGAAPTQKGEDREPRRWGYSDLYGPEKDNIQLKWLHPQEVMKVIQRVFLPIIEECIIDSTQIGRALQNALNGSSDSARASSKNGSIDLKKNLRVAFFELMTSHTIATPLYAVKLDLLRLLSGGGKVGATSRSKELAPMLQYWASLSARESERVLAKEHINISNFEDEIVGIVTPSDKTPVSVLLSLLVDFPKNPRPALARAVFDYIKRIWPRLKSDRQLSATDELLEIAVDPPANSDKLSEYAKEVLLSVNIDTEILVLMLEQANSSISDMRDHSPASKRPRTSQRQSLAIDSMDSKEIAAKVSRVTFVLELVDGSMPEDRPQILKGLFRMLASLRYFKSQTQSELPYLLSLTLGSMLAVVKKANSSAKIILDASVIRTDLIIDCVRMSENPQVQNTALLLIAALSSIAPELVLHSVMPIFTFMGATMLKKDDEFSAHVIDKTIDEVIPPLIQSLRSQKQNVVLGTSELLLSFTAAFEHIPTHRRLRLFEALIVKLGAEEFLFVVLAMLASRHVRDTSSRSFIAGLVNSFNIEIQLVSFGKYLSLVVDAMQPKPDQAQVLLSLNVDDEKSPRQAALSLLQVLTYLLQMTTTKNNMGKKLATEDRSPSATRAQFSHLLEQVLQIAALVTNDEDLKSAVNECLSSLLKLPSLGEYITITSEMLTREDDALRHKVLLLLESRLQQNGGNDLSTQTAAIALLSSLTRLLAAQPDVLLSHACIACIDRISERYGRKSVPAVVAAATVVGSEICLGADDPRIRVMSLLCLSSMADILKEAIIPIMPATMPWVFRLLENSMVEEREDEKVHKASFSLLAALLSHVPYIVSGSNLDSILTLAAESANSGLGENCLEDRGQTLRLVAMKIDFKDFASALQRLWSKIVENGLMAVKEAVETLSNAMENHSKASIVASAGLLSEVLLQTFDVRRIQFMHRTEDSYSGPEVDEIESALNAVAIKMIYKFNDRIFRPIFAGLVDWAVKCPGVDRYSLVKTQHLRQTTMFNFLTHFFATLKSIVTSYASYVLEPANEILKHTASLATAEKTRASSSPLDGDLQTLWLSTLSMLKESFSNDADAFFASPSHFTPLAPLLISQLNLSASSGLKDNITDFVLPAIVSLAVAVLDDPSHHKTLNHHICALRHSESAAVRMASVKCQEALTDSEDVGEEWLNNVMQGGEGMVYVNEMLEDEDEEVEKEIRKWVRKVRDILGEDILEG